MILLLLDYYYPSRLRQYGVFFQLVFELLGIESEQNFKLLVPVHVSVTLLVFRIRTGEEEVLRGHVLGHFGDSQITSCRYHDRLRRN